MMNKVMEFMSVFFKRAFCCFSLITVVMAIVGKLTNTSEFSNYISVNLIISFFLFALLFALSFGIADFVKNNGILRRFIQFVLTFAGVVIVFFVGGAFENYVSTNNVQNKGFSILAISFMFVVIYFVCGLISLVFGFIKSKLSRGNKDYKEMF